ncbi:MAG: hypothetical protein Q4Q53_09020, partial [Methanocorpusculum sp.]|nr:hypothetical protein [Methanocorpusculum sp.]
RHARVTIRPDKAGRLIKEKTAVPLRDYIDRNGNILCVKSEKIMKITTSYIAVKIRHKNIYEIYIPPNIKEIIGGYSLDSHIKRYSEEIRELNLMKQFTAQKELSRELDLPYSCSNAYSARAISAQMLLDRIAVITGFEEFKNPWYVSESGRKYMSQDM